MVSHSNKKEPVSVYALQLLSTKKIYVGYSHDLRFRLKEHLSRLRSGRHPNKELQKDFDGCPDKDHPVKLFVLEKDIPYVERRVRELDYIVQLRTYLPQFGYNTAEYSRACLHEVPVSYELPEEMEVLP